MIESFEIYPYGLGRNDEMVTLIVPKRNWGGAYIKTPDNACDEDVLARKVRFSTHDPLNYLEGSVEVRSAMDCLAHVFADLRERGLATEQVACWNGNGYVAPDAGHDLVLPIRPPTPCSIPR